MIVDKNGNEYKRKRPNLEPEFSISPPPMDRPFRRGFNFKFDWVDVFCSIIIVCAAIIIMIVK